MSNRVTVTIGVQSYTLLAKENPDYVREIAAHVNRELSEVTSGAHLSMADAAILTAVNISDKYYRERAAADNLRRQLKDYLDEGSRVKKELAELKRELFRLQSSAPAKEEP